ALLALIDGQKLLMEHMELGTELIVRNSTAPPLHQHCDVIAQHAAADERQRHARPCASLGHGRRPAERRWEKAQTPIRGGAHAGRVRERSDVRVSQRPRT
ncbi:hypothetical protein, partial [Streptomyces tibetensis]|uniref:hypothetical protein n=1 Tax=Streptomyces tibetensis TaxID=2382123 RepID=UPI0033F68109